MATVNHQEGFFDKTLGLILSEGTSNSSPSSVQSFAHPKMFPDVPSFLDLQMQSEASLHAHLYPLAPGEDLEAEEESSSVPPSPSSFKPDTFAPQQPIASKSKSRSNRSSFGDLSLLDSTKGDGDGSIYSGDLNDMSTISGGTVSDTEDFKPLFSSTAQKIDFAGMSRCKTPNRGDSSQVNTSSSQLQSSGSILKSMFASRFNVSANQTPQRFKTAPLTAGVGEKEESTDTPLSLISRTFGSKTSSSASSSNLDSNHFNDLHHKLTFCVQVLTTNRSAAAQADAVTVMKSIPFSVLSRSTSVVPALLAVLPPFQQQTTLFVQQCVEIMLCSGEQAQEALPFLLQQIQTYSSSLSPRPSSSSSSPSPSSYLLLCIKCVLNCGYKGLATLLSLLYDAKSEIEQMILQELANTDWVQRGVLVSTMVRDLTHTCRNRRHAATVVLGHLGTRSFTPKAMKAVSQLLLTGGVHRDVAAWALRGMGSAGEAELVKMAVPSGCTSDSVRAAAVTALATPSPIPDPADQPSSYAHQAAGLANYKPTKVRFTSASSTSHSNVNLNGICAISQGAVTVGKQCDYLQVDARVLLDLARSLSQEQYTYFQKLRRRQHSQYQQSLASYPFHHPVSNGFNRQENSDSNFMTPQKKKSYSSSAQDFSMTLPPSKASTKRQPASTTASPIEAANQAWFSWSVLRTLAAALKDKSAMVRAAAAEGVGNIGIPTNGFLQLSHAKLPGLFVKLLGDPDKFVRAAVLQAIAKIGPRVLGVTEATLGEEAEPSSSASTPIRIGKIRNAVHTTPGKNKALIESQSNNMSLIGLPPRKNSGLVANVLELLRDSQWQVRTAACDVLASFQHLCGTEAVLAVLRVLQEATVKRNIAARTLRCLGPEGVYTLIEVLKKDHGLAKLRIACAKALGCYDTPSLQEGRTGLEGKVMHHVVVTLLEFVKDHTPKVRQACLNSLAKLASQTGSPAVRGL
mmetsp:Transcript_931/g.1814  ORF Transcript_931/g.1814 Transcript_931/m.1814 type:complete len:967 (-) Transcript_931:4-2904(-)